MSIERYLKDDLSFRKYVELMETTPTAKRQKFIEAAKQENAAFAGAVEKYLITFTALLSLPEMEQAEVFGSEELKPEVIANAISSVTDSAIKEKLSKMIPKKFALQIQMQMKDNPSPKPDQIGAARLQVIQQARKLEKEGKLKSLQIPQFGNGYFTKPSKAA